MPSQLTTWSAWREANPHTWSLETPEWVLETPGPYPRVGLEDVVVVEFAGDAVMFPMADLRDIGVANEVVAGAPIAVVIAEQSNRQGLTEIIEAQTHGPAGRRSGESAFDPDAVCEEVDEVDEGIEADDDLGVGDKV